MENRKALFLDLDGTIFDNSTVTIPDSTIKAIHNLAPDVDLFLATGRSSFTLEPISTVLPFFKGFVLLNGQHVIYQTKTIHFNPMESKYIQKLYETTTKKKIPIGFVAQDKAYIYSYSEDVLQYFAQRSNQQFVECKEPIDLSIPIAMGWLFTSLENIEWMKTQNPELAFVKWGRFGADILKAGDSKRSGVEKILELGYRHENTYAIGNGENDIEMFESVHTSIAMGNSPKRVKESASYVTSTIDQDGIYQALTHFNLLK